MDSLPEVSRVKNDGDGDSPSKESHEDKSEVVVATSSTASQSKKVRFATGKDLCKVQPMVQWLFAYKEARKGPWEQLAQNQMQFKNRVSKVEPILSVVLKDEHRSKILNQRFSPKDD